MTENEEKTEAKTEGKLFQKGGAGGPGRGNVKDDFEGLDFWESTETLIRNAMGTGKTGDKLKAAKLYLQWQEMKKQHDKEEEQTLPDSNGIEHITQLLATKQLIDVISISLNIDFPEVVRLMHKHCLDCQTIKAAVKE